VLVSRFSVAVRLCQCNDFLLVRQSGVPKSYRPLVTPLPSPCHALVTRGVRAGSQYVIATHSPILMAYPDSWIYVLTDAGLTRIEYDDTEHVQTTRNFLASPERTLRYLFEE